MTMKQFRLCAVAPALVGIACLATGPVAAPACADPLYETSFARDEWNPEDWTLVKSPRWDYIGSWVQRDDCIENATPEDMPADTLVEGDRTYMSMVLREPFDVTGGLRITSTMEFEYDQAPQIVLAPELGASAAGYPEHREHYEVVLFSQGINIWRHVYEDGVPSWTLVAYSRFPLERRVRHEMEVTIERARGRGGRQIPGHAIVVRVGEHSFAYHEPTLADELYVGLIGYASANRFYDFRVEGP